ncbi:MAG: tetratricopeptide repeat protein [Phycisphaerae bacterium]
MPTRRVAILLVAAGALLTAGCQLQEITRKQAIGHFVRGQLLADDGEMEAALRELAEAVKADPDLSVAHCAIGDIHRKRGDHQLAKRSYEDACRANPYSFRPHYNLGVVFQVLSEAAQAVERGQEYLREAVAVYLRASVLDPDDFDTNLNLCACYFSLGKNALAEKYCKAAIAIKPDSPEAYSNLGTIYDSQGRMYQAIKAYKDSLELNVHQPKLLMNLGAAYMRQARLGPALNAFETATEEDPNSSAAWEQLGTCLYHRNELDEAMAAYQKAVSLNGSSAAAHRGIGVVYMTQYITDRKNADLRNKALAAWHLSLELEPDQEDIVRLVRKYSPKTADPEL